MAIRSRFLRIAAGAYRGRRLRVPAGIRPTTERVRAAIFDALQGPMPERVLDLYAGSGALGIEALSRGAGRVCFVERDRVAAATIRANISELDVDVGAKVIAGDVRRVDLSRDGPFDLVFADPPYASDQWALLFERLGSSRVLVAGAVLVAEMSSRRQVPTAPNGWHCWKERRHGDTVFAFFVYDATTICA
ncbi:MAG: 16S rRNA (guanine(966)-N(2))-methyltransferase RsmD [Pirellulaceae bacterium]|nr:16S rRNA (guanine(966)-N(2))-methyltransferase RsmD [Pirellulaceae bacterium]